MKLTDFRKKHNVKPNYFLRYKINQYIAFKDWYTDSKAAILEHMDEPAAQVFIDLLAATSPRNSVKQNLVYAFQAFEAYMNDSSAYINGSLTDHLTFGLANKGIQKNVKRVFEYKPIKGAKVYPFAEALKGDLDQVVIDSWMLKVFNVKRSAPTPADRECITKLINKLADQTNLKPAEVQACLWAYAKTELNDTPFKEANDFSYYLKQSDFYGKLKQWSTVKA